MLPVPKEPRAHKVLKVRLVLVRKGQLAPKARPVRKVLRVRV